MNEFHVIIPARYASQRLPGKPLLDIVGKPMIQRVYEQALLSRASSVTVATDDERILAAVTAFGGNVQMTSAAHETGTDRLAEVARQLALADDAVVVNVQGDEPLIPPTVINQVADNLWMSGAAMATLSEPVVESAQVFNPNVVKVVVNAQGMALYFSRAPIPWVRQSYGNGDGELPAGGVVQRHIGLYAYRVAFLSRYVGWAPCPLEQLESLEQLRALWHGERIHVAQAVETPPGGVDTEADLASVRRWLEAEGR